MRKVLFSVYCVGLALVLLLLRAPACSGIDGADLPGPPGAGEVALVEVMANPASGQPEWLELYGRGERRLDLGGCALSDGGAAEHVVYLPPGTVVEPGQWLVVAEEGPGAPADSVVVEEGALVINEDDADEVLRLHCPGADGALALVDDVLVGGMPPAPRGHSWMLERPQGGALDDDPARWCVAGLDVPYGEEAQYGTPGAANVCPEDLGELPRPGDVRITELMVAPDLGREWFELQIEAGVALDLTGCALTEGPDGVGHEHVLDPARGRTVGEPGELLVLAATELALLPGDGPLADYAYGGLTFNNDQREELALHCGGVEVERVAYDWTATGGDLGQALARDPDDPAWWCLATEVFHEDDEGAELGSPGIANPPCQGESTGEPPPAPGELVISELMIAPSHGTLFPEWLELVNVSARPLELDGCRVEDDGHAGALSVTGPLAPGAVAVVSRGTFDAACEIDVLGGYGGGATFNNGGLERCAVACRVEGEWRTVDEVWFDWDDWGLDKGWSLGLDAGAVDAASNDDPQRWCPAPDDAWSCTVQGYTDRGTPGALVECP